MTDRPDLDVLNRQARAGVEHALLLERELADLYAAALRKLGRHAADQFARLAPVHHLTAAVNPQPPDWQPPDVDELAADPLDDQTKARRDRIHLAAIEAAVPTVLKDLPQVSFDATSPFAAPLLERAGTKSMNLGLAARDTIRKVIGDAYENGLSVPETAAALKAGVDGISDVAATMMARTDLVGLANGASLQAIRALGDAAPQTKSWLTAEDDRVRPTHADADGQEVPVDQPFAVGDDLLDYPGDPNGSDAEVINCRCVVTYSDGSSGDSMNAAANRNPLAADAVRQPDSVAVDESLAVTAAASGSASLDLGPRDETWDAQAAKTSLKVDDYPDAFFWRDPDGDAKTLAAYKLGFAKRTPNGLRAVWRGVTAAAQRLSQTQIPQADLAGVRSRIEGYYAKARKAYDDDSIVAPWLQGSHSATLASDSEDGCGGCGHMASEHLGGDGPCTHEDGRGQCSCTSYKSSKTAAVTITVGGDDTDDDGQAAGAVQWQAVLCVEGEPTEDGRLLQPGSITWRDTPLSLGLVTDTPHGYGGAPVCGRIDRIWRDGNQIMGAGVFNPDETGQMAADLVGSESIRGVSVDLLVLAYELRPQSPPVGTDDVPDDGDGDTDWPEEQVEFDNVLMVVTDGVIGGATVCPVQAIANATISVVAFAGGSINLEDPGSRGEEAMTAAAQVAAAAPPRSWFDTTEPPGVMPLTVTDDGRVFGHIASWDTCHTGFADVCMRPPRSRSGYAYFHVGELETDDGSTVSVGKLMISKAGRSGKHAALAMSKAEAARHYDDNTAVAAYVRAVDGRHGIWVSGTVRPGITDTALAELKANPPSGDWRKVNGSLELIAALAVPVPGFPVPRANAALTAAADLVEVGALVACSGRLEPTSLVLRALERDGLIRRDRPRVARPESKRDRLIRQALDA